MNESRCSTAKAISVRTTVWSMVSALSLGALLGSAVMFCSWRIDASLWCAALQWAFSAMILAILAPIRRDMSLYAEGLPLLSEPGRGDRAPGKGKSDQRSTQAGLGLAAL